MRSRRGTVGGICQFFPYYGGKTAAASLYPKPQHRTIIEPFAGAAGYSLRWHYLNVILVEKNPVIAGIWKYLLTVSEGHVRKLPLVVDEDGLSSMKLAQEERDLIGFWLGLGSWAPRNKPTSWALTHMRNGTTSAWGAKARERVASQLEHIRHWMVIEGDYSSAPEIEATWFIDPPYQDKGKHYTFSSRHINFRKLGKWCRSREGQVIVCEQQGADWLPFQPFGALPACTKLKTQSREVIWLSEGNYPSVETREGFGLELEQR